MEEKTITFREDQIEELRRDWDIWNDGSYARHAAYMLRDLIKEQWGWKEDD